MCSVAVDFAKHGECVSTKNYEDMKKEIQGKKPDFMDGAVESEGVLGQLYRDVSSEDALL
jgi:hypothetical protein